MAQGHVVSDPTVTRLAAKYGRTPAQVVLRWHLDPGHLLACKTVSQARMAENMNVFDFSLEPEDALTLGSLPPRRYGPRPETSRSASQQRDGRAGAICLWRWTPARLNLCGEAGG